MSKALRQGYIDLRSFVRGLWAELNTADPPSELFHYTTTEGLFGILESKRLWAADALSMNDPTEGLHAGGALLEHLRKRKAEIPAFILDAFSEAEIVEVLDNQVFFSCFCADGDLLSQWRAYGRDGRGYALAFNPQQLLDATVEKAELARVV
ncbi:MAG: hypothetical protein ABSD96_21845 [Candidatus Korobacteraceae bacterium]